MKEAVQNRVDYEERAALLKVLANPVRLRLVHSLLTRGCHNVSCMEREIGMSQSCVSQHLQKLRLAGVVSADRLGNEVYYRVTSPEVAKLAAALFGEEEDDYAL